MSADKEAVEAARRIVEAADRRSATNRPDIALGAFSAACRELYTATTTDRCVELARAFLPLVERAEAMEAAIREIETICTESAGACRKRMGTRVGNVLVTAQAALSPSPPSPAKSE